MRLRRVVVSCLLLGLGCQAPTDPCRHDTLRLLAVREDGRVDTLTALRTDCSHFPPGY